MTKRLWKPPPECVPDIEDDRTPSAGTIKLRKVPYRKPPRVLKAKSAK